MSWKYCFLCGHEAEIRDLDGTSCDLKRARQWEPMVRKAVTGMDGILGVGKFFLPKRRS